MSYYLFPKGNVDLSTDISISIKTQEKKHPPELDTFLSPSLVFYLRELQESIFPEYSDANILELQKNIFPYQKGIFDKYSNYSAVFFEIVEIVQTMHLNHYLDMILKNTTLSIFSFEEEKNGGLSAIKTIREPYKRISYDNNKMNHSLGLNPIHVPYKDNYFFTETGYSLQSFRNVYFNYGSKMHIILADSTKCKTIQEMIIQLAMILCIQARKGILFWKVGDTYTEIMLDIFVILSSFYTKTYFIKPVIMDTSSSEKYIVCKGFILENAYTIYLILYRMISTMKLPPGLSSPEKEIRRLLSKPIPHFFVSKLEDINYMFGQAQLEQLHYLSVLKSHKYKQEKIQNISKINAQKTQEWLSKHHYFLHNVSFG